MEETLTTPRPTKERPREEIDGRYYNIQVHGGLGDCLWVVGKKLAGLDAPLYVNVSNENRHRPRRVGRMLDHLPCVIGWRYSEITFAPGGRDWTQSAEDPACAIGKTWNDLKWKPNTPISYRIECNRWLESGKRIEDWLPDLPTVHRVDWLTPARSERTFVRPSIVLHIAGWPDVPDSTWVTLIRLFSGTAKIYIVGGSYDHRPRRIYEMSGRRDGVVLLEDVAWEDLFGVLRSCDYCFGHASGFTAIADTLGVKGATFNPRTVERLIGTWNDHENTGMIHVDRVGEFERLAHGAYLELSNSPAATWPPSSSRGAAVVAADHLTPGAGAVYAAASISLPRQAVFVFDSDPGEPMVAASCVEAVLDAGEPIYGVTMVDPAPSAVASVYRSAARTTRKPVIDLPADRSIVLQRPMTYGLCVVHTGGDRERAVESITWGWAHTSVGGVLLVGGPSAGAIVPRLASARRTQAAQVIGADGWWYLHRAA